MKQISPNVVIPLMRRGFPSMVSGLMELPPLLAKQAEKWNVLSKRCMKMELKNWWHPWRHNVVVNVDGTFTFDNDVFPNP